MIIRWQENYVHNFDHSRKDIFFLRYLSPNFPSTFAEKLLKLIQNDRIHPGKTFNYEIHGFEKIEEAFKLMDEKPKDLIKPIIYTDDI